MCVWLVGDTTVWTQRHKDDLVWNHHVFTIWSKNERAIFYILYFQNTYLKCYIWEEDDNAGWSGLEHVNKPLVGIFLGEI